MGVAACMLGMIRSGAVGSSHFRTRGWEMPYALFMAVSGIDPARALADIGGSWWAIVTATRCVGKSTQAFTVFRQDGRPGSKRRKGMGAADECSGLRLNY